MKLKIAMGFGLVATLACGQHQFINIVDVSAARSADDRVTLTATVECEATGSADCAQALEYCVTATWQRVTRTADGGTTAIDAGAGGSIVDVVTACKSEVLGRNATTSMTLVSSKAIPKDGPIEIALEVKSASGGRNDLARLQPGKVPLLSP